MVLKKVLAVIVLSYISSQVFLVLHIIYSQPADFQALVDRESSEVSDSLKLSRKPLIEAILGLYALQYSNDKVSFYLSNGTFDDPLLSSQGRKEIGTGFLSMVTTLEKPVVNPRKIAHGKDFVAIDLLVGYNIKGLGSYVELPDLVVLKLEGEEGSEMIVHHYDKWYGKALLGTEEPLVLGLGHVSRQFRRFHNFLLGYVFSAPSGLVE